MPYIIKTIGIENYGVYALALALIVYCSIFIDYGFNLFGTEQISGNKHRNEEEKIFFNIIYAKAIIALVIFLFYYVILLSINILYKHLAIYLILYGNALGNLFFPLWFYHAKQSMGMITKIQVVSQILQTILIFILLKEDDGLLYLAVITGVSSLITGIAGFAIAINSFNLRLQQFSLLEIIKIIKSSWLLFLTRLLVNIYSNTNPILLAAIGGFDSLAIYTVSDRVVKAVSSILSSISATLLPQMVKIKNQSFQLFKNLFFDSTKITFIISFIGVLVIEILSGFIANYFSVEKVQEIKLTLQILSISLLFEPQGGLFTNLLVTLKEDKRLLKYTIWTSLINLILVIPLLYYFDAYGIAAAATLTQIFGFLYLLYTAIKLFSMYNLEKKCVE